MWVWVWVWGGRWLDVAAADVAHCRERRFRGQPPPQVAGTGRPNSGQGFLRFKDRRWTFCLSLSVCVVTHDPHQPPPPRVQVQPTAASSGPGPDPLDLRRVHNIFEPDLERAFHLRKAGDHPCHDVVRIGLLALVLALELHLDDLSVLAVPELLVPNRRPDGVARGVLDREIEKRVGLDAVGHALTT